MAKKKLPFPQFDYPGSKTSPFTGKPYTDAEKTAIHTATLTRDAKNRQFQNVGKGYTARAVERRMTQEAKPARTGYGGATWKAEPAKYDTGPSARTRRLIASREERKDQSASVNPRPKPVEYEPAKPARYGYGGAKWDAEPAKGVSPKEALKRRMALIRRQRNR